MDKEEAEKKEIVKQYRALLRKIPGELNATDKKQLRLALEVAADAHKHMRRKSGEPYITHPVAVAEIAANLHFDAPSIMDALLHDVVEDTDASLKDVEVLFGKQVSKLVDGF